MKRITLALSIVSLALTVTAAPRSGVHERDRRVGRHSYTNVELIQSVPEVTPTLALAIIGMASLGVAAVSLNRKKI
jgi:hypothetical protein